MQDTPAAAMQPVEDYLLVFGADSTPYRPLKTHTFAATVRVERNGSEPKMREYAWLSWLPEDGVINVFARPKKGRNVPLDETLATIFKEGRCAHLWGPFRIKAELAEMMIVRQKQVESQFRYKGASFTSPMDVCDCARSIEEMLTKRRRFMSLGGYGRAASSIIVQRATPYLIDPHETHPWVAALLGVDKYPIVLRKYGDYTSHWQQLLSMCWLGK